MDTRPSPRKVFWRQAAVPLLLAAGVVSFFLAPQGQSFQQITIENLERPQTIVLKARADQDPNKIYAISIRVSGEITGRANLERQLDKQKYDELLLTPGTIDEIWSGDWYSPECKIKYKPTNGITGTIKIEYQFNDL